MAAEPATFHEQFAHVDFRTEKKGVVRLGRPRHPSAILQCSALIRRARHSLAVQVVSLPGVPFSTRQLRRNWS